MKKQSKKNLQEWSKLYADMQLISSGYIKKLHEKAVDAIAKADDAMQEKIKKEVEKVIKETTKQLQKDNKEIKNRTA